MWPTSRVGWPPTSAPTGAPRGIPIDYLDVIPQYDAIQGGTWDAATVSSLQAMAASDVTDLNARLAAMTTVLHTITPQIAALH